MPNRRWSLIVAGRRHPRAPANHPASVAKKPPRSGPTRRQAVGNQRSV